MHRGTRAVIRIRYVIYMEPPRLLLEGDKSRFQVGFSFLSFFLFIYFFDGMGFELRQALYYLSHIPRPFCFSLLFHTGSQVYVWTIILLFVHLCVAG
jgi:hypothetical protein